MMSWVVLLNLVFKGEHLRRRMGRTKLYVAPSIFFGYYLMFYTPLKRDTVNIGPRTMAKLSYIHVGLYEFKLYLPMKNLR